MFYKSVVPQNIKRLVDMNRGIPVKNEAVRKMLQRAQEHPLILTLINSCQLVPLLWTVRITAPLDNTYGAYAHMTMTPVDSLATTANELWHA